MRISKLTSLSSCPGLALLPDDGPSGPAADTGSAVGKVIELWHREGHGVSVEEKAIIGVDAIKAVGAVRDDKYPQANMETVEKQALHYMADNRNHAEYSEHTVIPESQEAEVCCTLTCPLTGYQEELVGHMDQVRKCKGVKRVEVWDVKSGGNGRPANAYSQKYTWQIAAYTVALAETQPDWLEGMEVTAGGIILLSAYPKTSKGNPQPAAVFQDLGVYDLDSCRETLESAAYMLGQIAQGIIPITPGAHCSYCPGGSAPGCLQRLARL